MPDIAAKSLPPYAPHDATISVVGGMKTSIVPNRLDAEIMPGMSGGTRSHVTAAYKYLGLIDAENHPTDELHQLVKAHGTPDFATVYKNILVDKYDWVFSGLDMSRATSRQLRELFKEFGGAEGVTNDRCVRFFVKAMREAGIPFSPHLKARKQRGTGARRARVQASTNGTDTALPAATTTPETVKKAPETSVPEDMMSFPLYFKNHQSGSIIVPKGVTADDCNVIALTLKIIEAIAAQSGK